MNLPEDFIKQTRPMMGDKQWQQFISAMEEQPPVSIRLNPLKFDAERMKLPAEEKASVEWCEQGRYLSERPQFTLDPLLHAGAYYVQEAASMYVTDVVRRFAANDAPLMALDLCAAPGGKSTALRSVLPEGSLLMSNEPVRQRANILMENIQKFGHPDVILTNSYALDYQKSKLQFDLILCDVPCSGEGMFRKDEGAIQEWSVQNVKKCAQLQREIISDIMPCLRENGLLIYSTCTFNSHEDEENVDFICREFGMEKLDERHFIPGVTPTEGLYMAALRRKGAPEPSAKGNMLSASASQKDKKAKRRGKGNKGNAHTVAGAKEISQWLRSSDDFDFTMLGQRIIAVRKQWRGVFDTASEKLRVMHAGVEMGELRGKDIIPAEGLALSACLNTEAFPKADVDRNTAIGYLRREQIQMPANTPRGHVLLTYQLLPIGFVKNLGNRANNLFPQEWRIRMKSEE